MLLAGLVVPYTVSNGIAPYRKDPGLHPGLWKIVFWGSLSPTNSNSVRSIGKWGAQNLVNASWIGVSNALQGQSLSLKSELLSLI
jgi:hypothetical protein